MRRERREIQDLLDRLGRHVPPPSEHDLRAMARTASSRSRPLLPPAPSRRWPLQARWTGVLLLALVVAISLGIGLGALVAPKGAASGGPNGVGFLPEPGWFVLQSGPRSVPGQPAVAIAANVPFHPDDDIRGLAESSALPYATLQTLPPEGVVIAAAFSPRGENQFADPLFPRRSLPLRVRDAVGTRYGRAIRDGAPLGQYQLRASVDDQNVDLNLYFGVERPSRAQLDEAQRQLSGLVVRSSRTRVEANARDSQSVLSRVLDRTVVCSISPGNPREIDVGAESGTRLFGDRSKWRMRPGASFNDPRSTTPQVSAWISAGWPPIRADVGQPLRTDALSYSTRCRPSSSSVPLSTAGMSGSTASQFGDEYDCVVPQKILLRIRGVFYTPTSFRRHRTEHTDQLVAHGRVRESSLAMRTASGKPIALATVHESGRTRLFVGPSCGPNG